MRSLYTGKDWVLCCPNEGRVMAKNAMDLMKSMGNNPGRVTVNGSVKAHTKLLIDTLSKKTKMSNGEIIDAMSELFFEGFENGPEADSESEEPAPEVVPSPSPPAGEVSGTANHVHEGVVGEDPASEPGPDVEPGESFTESLSGTDWGDVTEDKEAGDPPSVPSGNDGSPEVREAGSAEDKNAGYPANLEIF